MQGSIVAPEAHPAKGHSKSQQPGPRGSRIAGWIVLMAGAVTAVSAYTFWRVDRVQGDVELVNRFYVPALKHLNLLGGKWSAYQRSFEQSVGFRKWGMRRPTPAAPKLNLGRMVEGNLAELSKLVAGAGAGPRQETRGLKDWTAALAQLAGREPAVLAEIGALAKTKNYAEAAAAYARARQEHLSVGQGLQTLTRELESRMAWLQHEMERELRGSQTVMWLLLCASLLLSVIVLFRVRRWLVPVVDWTRVAQEIALKGIHKDVRFPRITPSMPPEISLLTREFTRMGRTVLERERTIHEQKRKLESLNAHLKEQNGVLGKLGALNERILNSMSAALLVVNRDGVIEQFNDRYCELFNADRTDVLGRHAGDVVGVRGGWPAATVVEWLAASEPLHRSRLSCGPRVFDVKVQQLAEQAGRLLLFEDVTHLARAEERLEHARKLVLAGDLSAQVAHEVRNPLNSMALQLEMLDEDLPAEATAARGRVTAVAEQVHRLDRMTRRYLDVGRRASDPSRVSGIGLHGLIEKCIAFLSAEIQAEAILVTLDLVAGADAVAGDADALYQVIVNLVRNAIDALRDAPAPRRLEIATRGDGRSVSVRVSDNGAGIDGAVRERIFQPFTTTKPTGHGLGLSVSRQICIDHGGDLKLLSAAAGAAFELTLPMEKGAGANAPHPGC